VTTALFTDHYELTMVDAARASNRANRRSVFEVFSRNLPAGRRYGVVAGTARILEAVTEFRFGQEELDFLAEQNIVREDTLSWLANYRFSGTISGYQEGEIYAPGSPILTVEGTFAEAVVLETVILSILNYDSAVASAAARMVQVAEGRPLIEMGARRANEHAAVAAARAAYIAGFEATSNLEAGRRYGIPTRGTAAHSFTLVHDNEDEAFRSQVRTMGVNTTLLIDTYDIAQGVERAIAVAGTSLGAVRIDSGDLPVVVSTVRQQLDALGATNTRIVVTNDLNEYTIAGLRGAPVDAFGIGTSVVTGSGFPAVGLVYKLVSRTNDDGQWVSVAKKSSHKGNPGGKKFSYRRYEHSVAREELVIIGGGDAPANTRPLVTTLMSEGEVAENLTPKERVLRARDHHRMAVAELPDEAFSLSPGDPILSTSFIEQS
jgi:nicotinate phosphoribosyltransferase